MELISGVLMDAFFLALLLWCSITDVKKRLIPNKAIVVLLCLGIVQTVFTALMGGVWWQYPAGLMFAVPFFVAWLKNGMGAGDVKLVMVIALYLGFMNTVVALALIVPVLIGLMVYSLVKTKTVKLQIPIAPLLSIGAGGSVLIKYLYGLFL
ncbi:MAG: prepilin peptidase [Bacillota bacterium]